MILGLIPARGGSKGVPGKNTRVVAGKPLIAHAIDCGNRCPSIDSLIVSTDSQEIADVASYWGGEAPFIRPADLALDSSPMLPVMQHALKWVEEKSGNKVDLLVLLDPTAPLRKVEDVEGAIKLLRTSDACAVISGNQAHRNPYFNMVQRDGDYVRLVASCNRSIDRRQDAPDVYDLNTVVWVYSRESLLVDAKRVPEKTGLYEIPVERSVDLDTEADFLLLDLTLARMQSDKASVQIS
ncbi:MAG TPA: acylneuraminate cytidylyltransferase family protein [Acidiferrobacteraceae bacterium]|nr:acylneuraminate cytidylyltransferase family protein [Acidiferrobacteraceae bacterium]